MRVGLDFQFSQGTPSNPLRFWLRVGSKTTCYRDLKQIDRIVTPLSVLLLLVIPSLSGILHPGRVDYRWRAAGVKQESDRACYRSTGTNNGNIEVY